MNKTELVNQVIAEETEKIKETSLDLSLDQILVLLARNVGLRMFEEGKRDVLTDLAINSMELEQSD